MIRNATQIDNSVKKICDKEIERYISAPRLRSYEKIIKNKTQKNLIAAYAWNKHVSSAIYPIIQCLEISLRNALHEAASVHFKTKDWYEPVLKHGGDNKFIAEHKKFTTKYYRKSAGYKKEKGKQAWVSNHENMLKRAQKQLTKNGKSPSPDAIVSETMFGFWVSFFEDAYSDKDPKKSLWPHITSDVFKNNKRLDRKSVQAMLLNLKELRNRLSHHEPIWKNSAVKNDEDAIKLLHERIEDAMTIIRGISEDRYRQFVASGQLSYFKGICSKKTLLRYLKGNSEVTIDKRKLKRLTVKSLKQPQVEPIVLSVKGVPKIVIDLWPGCGLTP